MGTGLRRNDKRLRRRTLVVALFLCSLALSAPAQSPLSSPSRRPVPKGIPGFLDPSTGAFRPLADGAASPEETVSGVAHVSLGWDIAFGKLDSLDCTVHLNFGNFAGTPLSFFVNHTAQASFSAQAFAPPHSVDIPFSYTPNGHGKPGVSADIECELIDAFGNIYYAQDTADPFDLPSGSFYDDLEPTVI